MAAVLLQRPLIVSGRNEPPSSSAVLADENRVLSKEVLEYDGITISPELANPEVVPDPFTSQT